MFVESWVALALVGNAALWLPTSPCHANQELSLTVRAHRSARLTSRCGLLGPLAIAHE
jgi:hypothetical protein